MVIGAGMIAQRFNSYSSNENLLIFASGVSDSKSTDSRAYERETNLLERTISEYPDKLLVYFSTCSIYDPAENDSAYVTHKRKMEDLIQMNATAYNVFRVSNVVGKSANPNTVFNFFINHIRNKIPFSVWANATRNLIDIDDLYCIVHYILENGFLKNKVINIANPQSYYVPEIVTAIENHYGIKGDYMMVMKGSNFEIDNSGIQPALSEVNVTFDEKYLKKLLDKYAVNEL